MIKENKATEKFYGETFGGMVFFAFLVVYIIITALGSIILSFTNPSPTVETAVKSLFSVVSMAIILKIFSVERKEKIELTAYIKKFHPWYILPALLLAFGMLFGLGFVNTLVSNLVVSLGGKVSVANIPLDSFWQFLLFLFLIGFIAAFEEECFFRGLLLGNLKKGKKLSGIITVSLCFALYHGNISQLVYQFIYGIFLTYLTIKAKSTVPSITAHLINNSFILFATYFGLEINFLNGWVIAFGLSLLLSFGIFMYFYHHDEPDEFTELPEHKIEKLKDFYIPYGIFGIIICLVLIVSGVII